MRRDRPGSPTPTDVQGLAAAGVSLVGAERREPGVSVGSPADGTGRAIAVAMHESQPKVLLLQPPSWKDRFLAYEHDTRLASSRHVIVGGDPVPALHADDVVVLDERGRTPAQFSSDLDALAAALRAARLPESPVYDLWKRT